ncbi:MAG: hypothetical protein MUF49_12380 [Oculatellaceae cyanobacterium Prado106]|jgi:hypothetical protein|nr:hypothetical protein [Oculatellaceae cyanobacterium Prado106]
MTQTDKAIDRTKLLPSDPSQQWVCTACSFNMIGFYPKRCRFCGATPEHFTTALDCSATRQVEAVQVSDRISQLKSAPPFDFEHAAYRIDTGNGIVWIDCPSTFDSQMTPMEYILFTHYDCLGASNLYRQEFRTQVWIHQRDAVHPNSRRFSFDRTFEADFELLGIEAVVMGGHTPGFTLYFFEDTLFLCDYVERVDSEFIWNPYGNRVKTPLVGQAVARLLSDRPTPPKTVCGVDYVEDYESWKVKFDRLMMQT